MDNVVEREAQDAAALRREAVRAAQKSTTNVFLFRRLKWGPPGGGGGAGATGGRRISPIDILLWLVALIAVGVLAFTAISVTTALDPPSASPKAASHRLVMLP